MNRWIWFVYNPAGTAVATGWNKTEKACVKASDKACRKYNALSIYYYFVEPDGSKGMQVQMETLRIQHS